MTAPPVPVQRNRRFWRWAFWLILLAPMLPTIGLVGLAMAADVKDCFADMAAACAIGPLSAGHAFAALVSVAVVVGEGFLFVGVPWGILLLVAIQMRGGSLGRRLVKAILGLLFLSSMPFLGPIFPLESFTWTGCLPNEGGVGACMMFGVDAGTDVHRLAVLPWALIVSGGGVFLLLAGYALFLGIAAARQRARPA